MQFTPENAAKVMVGVKTQTRRTIKRHERYTINPRTFEIITVYDANGRIKWQVGRAYAVQPGRGKPAIGRVRLLSIRKEKLQDISLYDCAAELGETMSGDELVDTFLRFAFADLWDSINPKGKRWADNPDVWVLTFERVEG